MVRIQPFSCIYTLHYSCSRAYRHYSTQIPQLSSKKLRSLQRCSAPVLTQVKVAQLRTPLSSLRPSFNVRAGSAASKLLAAKLPSVIPRRAWLRSQVVLYEGTSKRWRRAIFVLPVYRQDGAILSRQTLSKQQFYSRAPKALVSNSLKPSVTRALRPS